MTDLTSSYGNRNRPPLDPSLYVLEEDQLGFFRSQTGIDDEEELRAHVLAVQAKAYEIYKYPCIRSFSFLRLKISKFPGYKQALKLGRERPGAILLDIGCCFGNDIRKAVQDGFPVENVIGSDLREGFWDLGHELFKSTPETFPAAFVAGDAFDPAFIAPREPFDKVPDDAAPALGSVKSLTPLQGHVSAIHASAFFHLFDEEKQLELAKEVATLLSPLPGSVIFGIHRGLPVKGFRKGNDGLRGMFCHSPESWKEVWDGQVFDKGKVLVEAGVKQVERGARYLPLVPEDQARYLLWWTVTRL
ncbi:hypothetical protein C8J56DRAFT_588891 [Mycena floridula]|nr:hypothetical protein C8J56DRAFT_588891 [Mycena floridula]